MEIILRKLPALDIHSQISAYVAEDCITASSGDIFWRVYR